MESKIKRFELVEITIPATTTGRVNFNTIPQLRNQPDQLIVIKNIEAFTVESYANSQQTPALPGLPIADIPKAVLVLYVNGEESVKMIPLSKLLHVQTAAGTPFQQIMEGFDDLTNVDFDKSYVQFATASNAAAYVIPFGITYLRLVKSATGLPLTTSTPQGNWMQG